MIPIPVPIQPFANHLWQSTLFAGVCGLLTLALRKNAANTRYWLWLTASVKFLVPFSLLAMTGSYFGRHTTAPMPELRLPSVIEQVNEPFAVPAPDTPIEATQPTPASMIPAILCAVWAIGFVAVVFSWWLRLRGIRAALRTASPLDLPIGMPVMTSPAFPEPGVFGIRRPVLLLPDGIAHHLTPPQLAAIVTHELCHVRRRDNLGAVVHMAVEALYWFHPLAWWLGARLMEERERACDEEVLRMGCEPQDYAGGILRICELCLNMRDESPLPCVSGVTGANLKKRIEAIMKNRMALKMTFARKAILALAGIAAVAAPIVVGIMNAPSIQAQSQTPETGPVVLDAPVKPPPPPRMLAQQSVAQQSVAPRAPAEPAPAPAPRKLEFEVSSVKPADSSVASRRPQADGGRFTYTATLHDLIGQAYRAFFPCPTKADSGDCAFPGAPAWIYKDRFAIEAKMPEGFPAYSPIQFMGGRAPQLNQMLQALLEDRFKLKVHWEARTMPIFALTIGKNGPKVKPLADLAPGRVSSGPGGSVTKPLPNGNTLSTMNVADRSMQEFVDSLGDFMDRPVLDRTGLKGNFDFKVEWESEPDAPSNSGPGMLGRMIHAGPSMFTAIEEQLGLKLESTKGPVEVLVIDHVEQPSAN